MREISSVLHVVPALFAGGDGITGGAERYAFELARHMADEVPTRLISFGARARQETVGRLTIKVIGKPWYVRGQRSNPVALAPLFEMRKADVVHCHQQHILTSSFMAIVGRLSRQPVFVTDMGGGGWDISAYVSTDNWYRGHLHISKYSRRLFQQEDKPFAHVIYGGVDTDKFSPDPSLTPEKTVLFVGRILPHKGVDDLIRALPDGVSLKIIGQHYDQKYLKDLHHLAEGKLVSFNHDCDDDAVVTAYRRALCVVLPSVYRDLYEGETMVPEFLGQTLLEGMACGTPAICTEVGSMPEVVEHGVTGFVVPPNDPDSLRQKISWLIEHSNEALEMGRRARKHVVEKFNWPMVVRRCLEIYAG